MGTGINIAKRIEENKVSGSETFFSIKRVEDKMWKKILVLAIANLFLGTNSGLAAVDQSVWDTLLKRYVDADGRVAYQDLKTNDFPTLRGYLKTLAEASLDGTSEDAEKAFWINAYNALTIKGILDGKSPSSLFGRYKFFIIDKISISKFRSCPII